MLAQQQSFQFSEYSSLYDKIVPGENLLRKINDLIDFSFIYDELVNTYCLNNGRSTAEPTSPKNQTLFKKYSNEKTVKENEFQDRFVFVTI